MPADDMIPVHTVAHIVWLHVSALLHLQKLMQSCLTYCRYGGGTSVMQRNVIKDWCLIIFRMSASADLCVCVQLSELLNRCKATHETPPIMNGSIASNMSRREAVSNS